MGWTILGRVGTTDLLVIHRTLFDKGLDALVDLGREVVDGKPIAGVADASGGAYTAAIVWPASMSRTNTSHPNCACPKKAIFCDIDEAYLSAP